MTSYEEVCFFFTHSLDFSRLLYLYSPPYVAHTWKSKFFFFEKHLEVKLVSQVGKLKIVPLCQAFYNSVRLSAIFYKEN